MKIQTHINVKIVLIAVLCLFVNCQKDDTGNIQQAATPENTRSVTKTVSGKDIPEVMQFIASKTNGRMQFVIDDNGTQQGQNRSHEDNLMLTNAITEQIKQVTNSYGKSNYTFKLIEEGGKTGVYFLNLVVKEYKDTFYLYIAKYVPDLNWLEDYRITNNLSTYTGAIYLYSDVGLYFAKIDMQNGTSTGMERHPCGNGDDDGDGNPDDPIDWGDYGDGNSNSDSGSGSGNDSSGNDSNSNDTNGNTSGNAGHGCFWYTYVDPNCNCGSGVLLLICPGGDRSMSDMLRHPCDNGNTGGDNDNDCAAINDCEFGWDADCECLPPPDDSDDGQDENNEVAINANFETPCENLKSLTVTNANVRVKLKNLITNTDATSEQGFRIRKNPGTNLDEPTDIYSGNSNCSELRVGNSGFTFAAAHSHPQGQGCNTSGMFSGGDVMQLAKMAKLYIGEDNNIYNTYTFMLTYYSTAYAIKFENQVALNKLVDIYEDSRKTERFKKKFRTKYQRLTDQFGEIPSQGDYIEAMFAILEDYNLDIALYKATTDNQNFVTDWNKINKETLVQEPCN